MYNKSGLKYFMYITTLNKNINILLPEDIRKMIWNLAHIYPYIQCYICDKVLINFSINMELLNSPANETENYTIINGLSKCNSCLVD